MPKPDYISEECVSYESLPEDKLANARQQGQAQFESILEMVRELRKYDDRLNADQEEAWEDAERRIHEDALSVEVRSDWVDPSYFSRESGGRRELTTFKATEYRILLCTGGPACQIVGRLNEYGEPETAVMQVQDWFQPWTEYRPAFAGAGEVAGEDLAGQGPETAWETAEDVMLAYARCFWFGE